jgi:hypothetical protein
LLDWIEVRAVLREIKQDETASIDGLADAGNFMNAGLIHDNDIASLKGRSSDLFDIGQKALAISFDTIPALDVFAH